MHIITYNTILIKTGLKILNRTMKQQFETFKKIILDNPDFKFEGKIISHNIVKVICDHVDEIIGDAIDSQSIQRRTYSVFVNMIQRITGIFYQADFSNLFIKIQTGKFYILTESTISNEEASNLAETIDKLNAMLDDKDTLKNYYKQILINAPFDSKGGGEIDLIDIIRRSNHNLLYEFTDMDETNSKVSLIAQLDIT